MQDKLSIIAYEDEAQIVLKPINMTLNGKEKVKYTLDRITLQRLNNLIAGAELGVMQANNVWEFYINSYFVLTGGNLTIFIIIFWCNLRRWVVGRIVILPMRGWLGRVLLMHWRKHVI